VGGDAREPLGHHHACGLRGAEKALVWKEFLAFGPAGREQYRKMWIKFLFFAPHLAVGAEK
jgi:hypothetical protein